MKKIKQCLAVLLICILIVVSLNIEVKANVTKGQSKAVTKKC